MIADSSHLASVTSTSALLGWGPASVGVTVLAVIVVAVCMVRSYRLQGGEPGAHGLDRWGVLGVLSQVAMLSLPRRFGDPPEFPRAAAVLVFATLAATLALWEVSARGRYRDRSPRIADPRHFLTYGPYRHVRRPRELVAILLVATTTCALPPALPFLPLVLVTVWAFIQRARGYDRAAAAALGDAYAAYRRAVALLVPRRSAAQRPGA